MGVEIVGVNHVGIAAAALCRMRVDHVVDEVQRVRLAVGRHEASRFTQSGSVDGVQEVQASVPRHDIENVLALLVGRTDHGGCGDAARTQRVVSAGALGRAIGVLEMSLPEQFAGLGVDSVDVV